MSIIKHFGIAFAAVVFTWLLHEFAHWLAGELTGNDFVMTLNRCFIKNGEYAAPFGWYTTIAGPLATVLQAITFYSLIHKYKAIYYFRSCFHVCICVPWPE